MECLGVCGEIRTLQVSLREGFPLPSGSVCEDSKKVLHGIYIWCLSQSLQVQEGISSKVYMPNSMLCLLPDVFSTSSTIFLLSISCTWFN